MQEDVRDECFQRFADRGLLADQKCQRAEVRERPLIREPQAEVCLPDRRADSSSRRATAAAGTLASGSVQHTGGRPHAAIMR